MKEVTFQLDTQAANQILTGLAMATVSRSTNAIAQRAQSMAGSISSTPPEFTVTTQVGTIRKGKRAIGRVAAHYKDARQRYVASTALAKAKDAGRVN